MSNPGIGVGSTACHVLRITRDALGRMAEEAPSALHVLQVGLVVSCCSFAAPAEHFCRASQQARTVQFSAWPTFVCRAFRVAPLTLAPTLLLLPLVV